MLTLYSMQDSGRFSGIRRWLPRVAGEAGHVAIVWRRA